MKEPWIRVVKKAELGKRETLILRLEAIVLALVAGGFFILLSLIHIYTQASPLLNFLLTWILPLILFVGIGQLMGRSLMKRMGGGPGNAMTFGKSNAKIYAESETGITFADVAGEEEATVSYTHLDVYKRQDCDCPCDSRQNW